jgi:hypothetical protein
MHGDGLISWQSPWRRSPEHGERRLIEVRKAERPCDLGKVGEREGNIDRWRVTVFVFHLSFGKR